LSRDAAAVTPLNLTKITTNGRNEHDLKHCKAANQQHTAQSLEWSRNALLLLRPNSILMFIRT